MNSKVWIRNILFLNIIILIIIILQICLNKKNCKKIVEYRILIEIIKILFNNLHCDI